MPSKDCFFCSCAFVLYFNTLLLFFVDSLVAFSAFFRLFISFSMDEILRNLPGSNPNILHIVRRKEAPNVNWHTEKATAVFTVCLPTNVAVGHIFQINDAVTHLDFVCYIWSTFSGDLSLTGVQKLVLTLFPISAGRVSRSLCVPVSLGCATALCQKHHDLSPNGLWM